MTPNYKYKGKLSDKKDLIFDKSYSDYDTVKLLVKEGFFNEYDDSKISEIKSLNDYYRPVNSKTHLFASIIFENKCYKISDDYISDFSKVINNILIKKADKMLSEYKAYCLTTCEYKELSDIYKFYHQEIEQLSNKKVSLMRTYKDCNYDKKGNIFSPTFNKEIKSFIHKTSQANIQYLMSEDEIDESFLSGYISDFLDIIVNPQKEKFVVDKLSEKSDLQDIDIKYHKHYDRYFLNRTGFEIFKDFIITFRLQNINKAILKRLKTELNDIRLNNDRIVKKNIKDPTYLEIVNSILKTKHKDLSSSDSTNDDVHDVLINIKRKFEEK